MVGYVGQHGWTHDFAGKSSSFRDNVKPIIYVCPSSECSAQIVFDITRATLDLVGSVSLTMEHETTSLLLAQSEMHKPRGLYGTPSASDYEARIHSMLRPTSHHEYTMVAHDPATGLPSRLYTLEPSLGPDGELLMLPAPEAISVATPDSVSPVPAFWGASRSDGDVTFFDRPLPPVPQENRSDLPPVALLPDGASLSYRPNPKKPGSLSHARYAGYERATSIAQYWTLTGADGTPRAKALADLRYDILHHYACVQLPQTIHLVKLERARLNSEVESLYAHVSGEAGYPTSPDHTAAMLCVDAYAAEAQRLDSLEEHPRVSIPDSYHHGLLGDPRRYTARYARGADYARLGVTADYSADSPAPHIDDAFIPPFGPQFDIAPCTIMHTSAIPDSDLPRSVSAAMKRHDYDIPYGWKPAIIKEVERVKGFNAIHTASMRDYHEAVKKYGADRVSIGYLVVVFKCKTDPNGDPREGGVCRKFRISVSEGGSSDVKVDTFSSCVDDITNRIVTLVGSTIDAKQTSIDVGGAYFHGTPPHDGGGWPALIRRLSPVALPLR